MGAAHAFYRAIERPERSWRRSAGGVKAARRGTSDARTDFPQRAEHSRPTENSRAAGTEPAAKRRRSEGRQCGVQGTPPIKFGAGNGIRTRDFDLGKVALYH